jgi:hypothetical protein
METHTRKSRILKAQSQEFATKLRELSFTARAQQMLARCARDLTELDVSLDMM